MNKWLVPLICFIPGGACTFFIIKSTSLIPEELRKIYEFEKGYGGCNFWFVKSSSEGTGWNSYEAVNSATLRKKETTDKIRVLVNQLANKGDGETENNSIREKCKERSGQILELVWGASNKWTISGDDWTSKEHKQATDD